MKTIDQKYEIKAPVEKVWEALVNPKKISAWSAGPAKMDAKVGTKFSLWGGDIRGKNIEVIVGKKLVQEWFGGDWQNPSIVTFSLKPENRKTIVELHQTDIPDKEAKDIADGWKEYYLGPLKDFLER